MAKMQAMTLRLNPTQVQTLKKLSAKTGLDRTSLIRLAIAKLAESEGIKIATDQR
ncbi:MAG TPA: ribbon-helix-helix domain-containing protein [Alloacidobacterium sp.]|nr:ribbon-helix-helix domain-containing protein [Alloacidobacterium sp.]